ncbi:hypothetical protein ASPBRDRAFT_559464 [Aspergillus brasiliensis CBS 101740]|uniref:Uncharacterized protein n=1 Tax=Aspergillus brasiliensis (strain CBS 101740 / IMI 381727 / IBT 21946) TaxID=767769 RepID=A0A1L9UMK3_ASPBC|nr:hypothetical protein ASPBRDRAFT_559464 [Aspergillus brasiliensis CBS 101740]
MEDHDMRIAKRTIWSGVNDGRCGSRVPMGKRRSGLFWPSTGWTQAPRPVPAVRPVIRSLVSTAGLLGLFLSASPLNRPALVLFLFFVPVHNWIPMKAQSLWVESMGPLTRCPVTLFPLTSPPPKESPLPAMFHQQMD